MRAIHKNPIETNAKPRALRHFAIAFVLMLLLLPALPAAAEQRARLDVITLQSGALKGNPLRDPAVRRVAVFVSAQFTNGMAVPIVYYLPGYGSSSENAIKNPEAWLELMQRLTDQNIPLLLVMVDGRTRWGGSQYLNSPAQGNYADYVCRDVLQAVEARYSVAGQNAPRIIAGHSSGGFGALRLGMANHKLFRGVIALSPDSDFEVTHLPLVKAPAVSDTPANQARLISTGAVPLPKNGDLLYALGLSAAYAPRGRFHPGAFDWLYDDEGRFRQSTWQRWLRNDPLSIVQKDPHAFDASQMIYLDGAAQDQFLANVGAREVYKVLEGDNAKCAFYEPPGKHGDHVPERLERGLMWFLGRTPRNIE